MKPIAYLMVERNNQTTHFQTSVPTREEKISHQPYPLYHLEDGVRVYNNREECLSESFDRTASHMAGEYVSYEEQQEWLRNVRRTGY